MCIRDRVSPITGLSIFLSDSFKISFAFPISDGILVFTLFVSIKMDVMIMHKRTQSMSYKVTASKNFYSISKRRGYNFRCFQIVGISDEFIWWS